MSGVGSILSGFGSILQGNQANAIAKSQAAFLRADAEVAREVGGAEATQIRREGDRAVGEAVAMQGASGFAMDATAMDVIAELAGEYDYQARTARYEAGRTARRLENEAAVTRAEGRMARTKGLIDGSAKIIQGSASLLSGSGNNGDGGG